MNEDKRIIELTATSELDATDFLPIDNSKSSSEENSGTRKIRVQTLLDSTLKVMLTQAEYDDLPSSKLTDGKVYYITDESKIIINGAVYGAGGETVADVYVNGTSVVDLNKIAQIKSYKEVTQAEYDALPSSKLTDGIMYCITDSEFSAEDVPYDNSDSHAQSTEVQGALDEAFERTVVLANGITSAFNTVAENYTSSQHNYTKGDYVLYETKLYRCISDTSGAWDSTKWEEVKVTDEIKDIQADVDNKADVDGMYEELFAGNLVTDMHTADNTPYLYRQSPSASSVSQNIVGGTVAWNQLASFSNAEIPSPRAGLTFSTSDNKSCTVNGTSTAATTADGWFSLSENKTFSADKINHVYYFSSAKISGSATDTVQLQFTGNLNSTKGNLSVGNDTILKITSVSSNRRVVFYSANNNTFTDYKFTLVCIDLTQMFGTTIADYIYSLEQATAGSGIAWLKSYGFLTKDYYAYQSGKLESVNVASRKVGGIGKNQFDKNSVTFTEGFITNTGEESTSIPSYEHTSYIVVKANTSYVFSGDIIGANLVNAVAFYDKDKNFISRFAPSPNVPAQFTTPNNTVYIRTNVVVSKDINTIQLEIGSTATDYETYKTTTYPLDSDLTLRGIVKKDANNNLYYDGDVYESDGSVTRRYGIVDLGDITWRYTNGRFYYNTTDAKVYAQTDVANMLCSQYPTSPYTSQADNSTSSYAGYIYVRADSYSGDTTAFKTAMDGVQLVYELATPTSETADSYENPQLVGSTEEFIDTRDVPIPVGGERKYYTDLKAKLEELAKIPSVPTTNGTYTLKATRSASGVVYSWVSG